jgi:two-component sensor histidine kinase
MRIMQRGATPFRDEPRDSFLLRLTDAVWALSDPVKIQAATVLHLGERLRANRVFYADIVNGKEAVIHEDFVDGLDSIKGHHPVESLVSDAATLRRGGVAIRNDLASDAGLLTATGRTFENVGAASYMAVGLVKDGHWIAVLGVQSAAARAWTPHETDLLQETAKRALIAIDRARTLAQKEALLDEMRHRFKNNLQLITSLINLQTNQLEDGRLSALFDETRNRVFSIATVYETIGRSQALDITAYATRLAPALMRAYDAGERVQARIEGESVTLDLRRAVPFGLLLHELFSNICKHAFPAGRRGEVSIRFDREDHMNVLTVIDNGIGFRSDLDFHRASSLGLKLIHMLAQQLGGDVTLVTGAGVHVRVRFPVTETTQEEGG